LLAGARRPTPTEFAICVDLPPIPRVASSPLIATRRAAKRASKRTLGDLQTAAACRLRLWVKPAFKAAQHRSRQASSGQEKLPSGYSRSETSPPRADGVWPLA